MSLLEWKLGITTEKGNSALRVPPGVTLLDSIYTYIYICVYKYI